MHFELQNNFKLLFVWRSLSSRLKLGSPHYGENERYIDTALMAFGLKPYNVLLTLFFSLWSVQDVRPSKDGFGFWFSLYNLNITFKNGII